MFHIVTLGFLALSSDSFGAKIYFFHSLSTITRIYLYWKTNKSKRLSESNWKFNQCTEPKIKRRSTTVAHFFAVCSAEQQSKSHFLEKTPIFMWCRVQCTQPIVWLSMQHVIFFASLWSNLHFVSVPSRINSNIMMLQYAERSIVWAEWNIRTWKRYNRLNLLG